MSEISKDDGLSAMEAAEQYLMSKAPQEDKPETEVKPDDESDEEESEDTPDEAPTEDKPDDDEDADEADESDGDDTDTDEDPETDPEPLATIEIDGEKIPLEEVKKGYQRRADYTRKTQELAEKRKEFDGHAGAVAAELKETYEELAQFKIEEPNWKALYDEDPLEAPKLKLQWDERKAAMQKTADLLQKRQQQELEAARATTVEVLTQEDQWRDQEKFAADMASLTKWARQAGFSDQDLVYADTNPVFVKTMWKAMQNDQKASQSEAILKKVKTKPKVTKPGAKSTVSKEKLRVKEAKAKARNSGSVQDAALAWLAEKGG